MLPKIINNSISSENIGAILCNNTQDKELIVLSKSLQYYLNTNKKKINEVIDDWDTYKKYTNPYEYIHTSLSSTNKISISKIKPLSRSFYKMIEICSLFNFFDNYNNPTPIKSFHLAEGPGGFIEAFVYIRNNPNDTYYGMTLISDNMNIPSWKKSKLFLQKNKNVVIESGITNTGDLMSKKNLLYCLDKYNNSMNVVSGDGGFDFSVDFNNQEQICTNLIFAQICFAIAIQKQGGSFVLKVFDIFTQASIDLLYILSNCYEKVYIIKPNTSRVANSEKYIICKNFVLENSKPFVLRLSKIYDVMDCEKTMENEIRRFLNINISHYYINKLEEINAIFGQQQIENINATFNLIGNTKNDKIELYKKNNISKCTHWCQKYNIPYNKTITAPNIFMSSRDSSHDSSHDSFSDDTDEPILQSNLTKNETYTNSK